MADGYFMRSDEHPEYYDHWSAVPRDSMPRNCDDYQPLYPSSPSPHEFPVGSAEFDGPAPSREDYHRYHLEQQQRYQVHRRPEYGYDPTPWKQPRMNDSWHHSVYSGEMDDDAGLDFSRPSCADVKLVMVEEDDLPRRSHYSGAPRRMLKANRNGLLYKARVRELQSNCSSIFRSKAESEASAGSRGGRRQDKIRKMPYGEELVADETIDSSESTSTAVRPGHEHPDQDQDDRSYCLSPISTIDPDYDATTELLEADNECSEPPSVHVETDKTKKNDGAEGSLFACVDNFFKLVDQFTSCNSPADNAALFDDEDDALLRDCLNAELNAPFAATPPKSDACVEKAADDSKEGTGSKNQENVDYLKLMSSLKENVQLCPGFASTSKTGHEGDLPTVNPVTPVSSSTFAADYIRVDERAGNTCLRTPHSGDNIGVEQLEYNSHNNLVELNDDAFLKSARCVSLFIEAASNE
jgi:hypothetical protein